MNYHEKIDQRAADVANRMMRNHGYNVHDALLYAEKFTRRCLGGHSGTFEVEYIDLPSGSELAYLNSGDTYTRTLCSIDEGEVFVSTWGDCVEQDELEYCENEDVIRCGWCSYYTPMDCEDWHDVVCESCGHHVDGGE